MSAFIDWSAAPVKNKAQIVKWDTVPVVFDVTMAAHVLGKSSCVVREQCRRGQLPAIKVGRTWRFEKSAFIDYIRHGNTGGTGSAIRNADRASGARGGSGAPRRRGAAWPDRHADYL